MNREDLHGALPEIKDSTIDANLWRLIEKKLMHCTAGKYKYYALIDHELPNVTSYIDKTADRVLNILKVKPMKRAEIQEIIPEIKRSTLGKALKRLQGKEKGYDQKITMSPNYYYCIKYEFRKEN